MMDIKDRFAPNMLLICIDRWNDMILSGRMYSKFQEEAVPFENFEQMILVADHLFDEMAFPQAFQKKRSFAQVDKLEEFSKRRRLELASHQHISEHKGMLKTFVLCIEARQHTSWQGNVLNTDFQIVDHFDDIVGLLNILIREIG